MGIYPVRHYLLFKSGLENIGRLCKNVGYSGIYPVSPSRLSRRYAMFYRIHSVNPLRNKHLLVCFLDDTVKPYDMEPLIRSIPAFQILEEPVLFNQVRVDAGDMVLLGMII